MALKNTNPSSTAAWKAIQNHFETIKSVSMKNMFQEDPSRTSKFHIQWNDFLIDYSK
jgi:glucose-6-phosphate isomerase